MRLEEWKTCFAFFYHHFKVKIIGCYTKCDQNSYFVVFVFVLLHFFFCWVCRYTRIAHDITHFGAITQFNYFRWICNNIRRFFLYRIFVQPNAVALSYSICTIYTTLFPFPSYVRKQKETIYQIEAEESNMLLVE